MKTIYHYDGETGEFLGIGAADVCPVTGGWLFPAHCTDEMPPDAVEGKTRHFNGAWEYRDIPQPEPEITQPPPTPEEIIKNLTAAVQYHLDTKAQERSYDSILSACTYATSTNPKFQSEGQACVEWRDAVWAACYLHMDRVLAGEAPVPTDEELIAMLPAFTWPL